MRQAQGIGINVVIIAAIALLVLIIIAIIVAQSGGNLRGGLESCSVKGGICSETGSDVPTRYVRANQYSCPGEFQECYVPS